MKNRSAGYTLLETLMTLTVAAIVMAIAVPSYQYVTNSNRIASEVNGLVGDLQFARAEAIKEGRNVSVCVSADSATCLGPTVTTWESGWIVFSDPADTGVVDPGEAVLRVQPKFSSTDTFDASNNVGVITFNREGYAIGIANGTLISLQTTPVNNTWTRCLSINLTGLLQSLKYNDIFNGVQCL